MNWFDKKEIDTRYFSIEDTLGEINQNADSLIILNNLMVKVKATRGDVAKEASGNDNLKKMMANMALKQLLKQAGDAVSKEQVIALNEALQKIRK